MPCAPLRPLFSAILAGFVLFTEPTGFAAEKRKPTSGEEVAKLKRENEVLRAENRRLRKDLAETIPKLQPLAETSTLAKEFKGADTRPRNPGSEKETGFWLSDNGKRHNANCQYYRKSKGKPCGANEGAACKVCGG